MLGCPRSYTAALDPFNLETYAILKTNAQTARTGDSVRKLVIVGAVIALISLPLFGRSLRTPEDKPLASQVREDTPEMVDLSGPREGTVGPERALYEGSLNADDPELVRSHPTSRRARMKNMPTRKPSIRSQITIGIPSTRQTLSYTSS